MYQNVKDTQNELREQQPPVELRRSKNSPGVQKHHSSVSDIVQVKRCGQIKNVV